MEALQVVAADDEGKGGVRVFLAEGTQGLVGVGRTWHLEFEVAGCHARFAGYGGLDDCQAFVFFQEAAVFFPRVPGGDDKPDFPAIAVFQQVVRNCHVPVVQRIERAEEKPDGEAGRGIPVVFFPKNSRTFCSASARAVSSRSLTMMVSKPGR